MATLTLPDLAPGRTAKMAITLSGSTITIDSGVAAGTATGGTLAAITQTGI